MGGAAPDLLHPSADAARHDSHAQSYLNLVSAIPDIVYVLDASGNFLYLNESIASLGYRPSELWGKHFTTIIHPGDRDSVSRDSVLRAVKGTVTGDAAAPKLFDERRSGRRMTRNLEVRLIGPEGQTIRYSSVNAYGEIDAGTLPFDGLQTGSTCTVGIIRDITEAKERETELRNMLHEREILLGEVHHRVKNNLQVITSLLRLSASSIQDEASKAVFQDCRNQVQAMAFLHEALLGESGFETVPLGPLLERLLAHLAISQGASRRGIRTCIHAVDCHLEPGRALPLSLIFNELITNCFKHAFPGTAGGTIDVTLSRDGPVWILCVQDRRVAVQSSEAQESLRESDVRPGSGSGSGHRILGALVSQIHGTISWTATAQEGRIVRVGFPA